ncbi:hypothetical protein [Glycomyces xiaoerkulensis]|uniref:hypothetical protein n=1 Tax=Glycomyces xiaoerkulensis TaxID=2038139 RepID=UPI000C26B0AC|nr:hypothetical protein [Glycomyces xiaoerkulensis]
MSRRINRSHLGVVDYELHCDRCGTLFRCGDDSYFNWRVLCAAAEAEGWRIEGGAHECADCAGSPTGRVGDPRLLAA